MASEVPTSMLLMALVALMAIGAGLVYVVVTLTRDQRRAEEETAVGSNAAGGAAGGVARGGMARMRAGAARCVRSSCAVHPAHRLQEEDLRAVGLRGWLWVGGWCGHADESYGAGVGRLAGGVAGGAPTRERRRRRTRS